jgi:peptidoglycan/xylan/chitin deacetylase (PgdA/CDA1 family)
VKSQLRSALKPVSALADRVIAPRPGLTILIYHRVGGASGGEVDIDIKMFADQMAELGSAGRAVSLDDGIAWLAGKGPDIESPVAVTFDDGTPEVFDHALPVLVRHDIPATLYLATRYVDEGLGFWTPDDPALSWATVADGLTTGLLSVGSHTHTHSLLDRLPAAEIADELDRSARLIEDNLGVPAEHFAYPKALPPSVAAAEAVRQRFLSAALAGTRANPVGRDRYRLTRSPIQRSDGMRWFRHKLDGGMGLEDRVRELVNRRRYAGATR